MRELYRDRKHGGVYERLDTPALLSTSDLFVAQRGDEWSSADRSRVTLLRNADRFGDPWLVVPSSEFDQRFAPLA